MMMPGGSIYTFQVATKMATSPHNGYIINCSTPQTDRQVVYHFLLKVGFDFSI